MDKEKIFTLTECEAIIAVSEAIAIERVHPEAVDFCCSRAGFFQGGTHELVHSGTLLSLRHMTVVQDSSGPVAQSSLTPALSSWSLYRMRSEALLANLRES